MPPKTPISGTNNGLKRKQGPNSQSQGPRKRFRNVNARAISRQTVDAAYNNGELNLDKFVKAREYEIRALEAGLRSSKDALSKRAFQEVPRDLRRRTASHNVKRVPKRLRARAKKEMKEDNTPTVQPRRRKPNAHARLRLETAKRLQKLSAKSRRRAKEKKDRANDDTVKITPVPKLIRPEPQTKVKVRKAKPKLRAPPMPRAKYRKRQLHKAWLPTHMYHTKRAHMPGAKEALWGFSIPISPTNKVYRVTHRASTLRSAVAWDISYMSTIGLSGREDSILGLLGGIGIIEATNQQEKWLQGSRSNQFWAYERDSNPRILIAPVTVVWNATGVEMSKQLASAGGTSNQSGAATIPQRQAFVRVHPASFRQLWEQVIRLAKVQKPSVKVEDLRFEIGSIEIIGPSATEALLGTLWSVENSSHEGLESPQKSVSSEIWSSLRCSPNGASLPPRAIISLNIIDPRLHFPPRKQMTGTSSADFSQTLQTLTHWPLDKSPQTADIFDRSSRLKAARAMPSQRSVNKRKASADPGRYPPSRTTDPAIPVLLVTSKVATNNQSSWTVLMPWKCVDAIWRSLVYQPLTCGGQIRFGGLNELRQINFEACQPWFPGDYPGTKGGDEWEARGRDRREREWRRFPKGRRIEYETLKLGAGKKGEIGEGWSCDWEKLLDLQQTVTKPNVQGANEKAAPETESMDLDEPSCVKEAEVEVQLASPSESKPKASFQTGCLHITTASALRYLSKGLSNPAIHPPIANGLITVKLSMLTRGVPQTCARIYRLPTNDCFLLEKWLALLSATSKSSAARKTAAKNSKPPPKNASAEVYQEYIASSLIRDGALNPGSDNYPDVPDAIDLIGFVTTGNFNMGEGSGTGIGSILLSKVLEPGLRKAGDGQGTFDTDKYRSICIVRDSGQRFGRLARWVVV